MKDRDVLAEVVKVHRQLFNWYWEKKPQKPILKSFRTAQEIADIIEYDSELCNISETDYINQAILWYTVMMNLCSHARLEEEFGEEIKLVGVEFGDGTKKINE